MNNRQQSLRPLLLGMTFVLCGMAYARSPLSEPQVLARVEVVGNVADVPLPVYAHLKDGAGHDYVLVRATLKQLDNANCVYRVLDADAKGHHYAIAIQHGTRLRPDLNTVAQAIHDDGRQMILRADINQADAIAGCGLDFEWMSEQPIETSTPDLSCRTLAPVTYRAAMAAILEQITEEKTKACIGGLCGAMPVTIGGAKYTFKTRNTHSGAPIQKATQWGYECMEKQGLAVNYHSFSKGRNVIAEIKGTKKPAEVVVLIAHLDDMPASGEAPGADDNASGSAGVLLGAEAVKGCQFDRTLRCILVTGEEQGLLGSSGYASACKKANEKIVGVVNMDMIATDRANKFQVNLHVRSTSSTGYAADASVAKTFADVVKTYKINLKTTTKASGLTASDHSSFWKMGYPAIFATERDFSSYYHTSNDTMKYISIPFCTNVIKAAVGTVAQLAGLSVEEPIE